MEVYKFTGSQIKTEFAGVGLWRLALPVHVELITSEGRLGYTMLRGFPTDMRSGSHAIDWLIPKFTKNNRYNLALLCHDMAYTKNIDGGNFLSRELADSILRQMCILSGELGKARAAVMHRAVRLFGKAAYESENDGDYIGAEFLMGFTWRAK